MCCSPSIGSGPTTVQTFGPPSRSCKLTRYREAVGELIKSNQIYRDFGLIVYEPMRGHLSCILMSQKMEDDDDDASKVAEAGPIKRSVEP